MMGFEVRKSSAFDNAQPQPPGPTLAADNLYNYIYTVRYLPLVHHRDSCKANFRHSDH